MNLPNKLTMLRIIMVPVLVVIMLLDFGRVGDYVAAAIFIAASLTDLADGKIARKYNMVTNFGKFSDPLADKLLVCSAMICLMSMGRLPAWVVILIVGREFIISGFRLVAAGEGIVIAASYWGKFKTTAQMVMIILLMIHFKWAFWRILEQFFVYLSVILTVVSLADYIVKNHRVIKDGFED